MTTLTKIVKADSGAFADDQEEVVQKRQLLQELREIKASLAHSSAQAPPRSLLSWGITPRPSPLPPTSRGAL